jgi:hypothetical protein
MKTIGFSRVQRASALVAVPLVAALARPELAFASSLRTQQARQHFGWLEQFYQVAAGVLPMVAMLAIVGGIMMHGIGGASEGMMKKIGLPVACFGVAALVLSSGSFLGIGAAVL